MKQNKRSRATGVQTEQTPRRPLSAAKKVLIVSMCLLATVTGILATAVGYAYFTKEEIYDAYFGASMGELFDHLSPDVGLPAYQEYLLKNKYAEAEPPVTPPENPAWGSEWNPYVISEGKHLNNLSQLQNIGYFDKHYISHNYNVDTNGQRTTYKTESKEMPYFLVCDKEGKPVCIEGANEMIKPIGTEEYPFIGSIQGAFLEGTCDVDGKSSDVSVLHDVNIASTVDSVDVGLFAHISFLGDMKSAGDQDGYFKGYVSEVSNLLLYDVTVSVDRKLWFDAVWEFVENSVHTFAADLNGTTTEGSGTTAAVDPEETHHLGIFAGHVSYSRVTFISVYYSSNDSLAIDLSHAKENDTKAANYMSASGIIGFLQGLNPTITADGEIKQDSGVNNNNILAGTTVGGTGGGALSGTEAGYVIADSLYEKYKWLGTAAEKVETSDLTLDTMGSILIKDAHDEDGNPLCQKETAISITQGESKTGKYYFYDGVFTFALSNNQMDRITPTWPLQNDDGQVTCGPVHNYMIGDDWQYKLGGTDKSLVAFLRPVTTDKEFNDAVTAGKKLVVLHDLPSDAVNDTFVMTLNDKSVPVESLTPDKAYSTHGYPLNYKNELKDTLQTSYLNGVWTPNLYKTAMSDFVASLNKKEYTILHLGDTGSVTVDPTRMADRYTVTGNKVSSYQYYYENSNMTAPVTSDESRVSASERYDGSDSGTTVKGDGYFEFYIGGSVYNPYAAIRWVPLNGVDKVTFDGDNTIYNVNWYTDRDDKIKVLSEILGKEVFKTSNNRKWNSQSTSNPVTIYELKYKGVTYYGPVYDGTNLYNATGSNASIYGEAHIIEENGRKYLSAATVNANCFLRDTESGNITIHKDGAVVKTNAQFAELDPVTGAAGAYTYNGTEGLLIDKVPQYTLSSENNLMQLVTATFSQEGEGLNSGTVVTKEYTFLWNGEGTVDDWRNLGYGAYSGPDGLNGNAFPAVDPTKVSSSTTASIRFVNGQCQLKYDNGTSIKYVSYDSTRTSPHEVDGTVKGAFTGIDNSVVNTVTTDDIKIYVLEATKYGAEGVAAGYRPMKPYAHDFNDGKGEVSNYSAGYHILYANSSQETFNNNFTVKSLKELGWRDDSGALLDAESLSMKFQMSDQIKSGTAMNLWGIYSSNENLVTAPVGTNGVKANIPQSCIAFRLNAKGSPDEPKKIRVIVAVPTDASLNAGTVCYFNLWRFAAAGWENGVNQTFDPANTVDRFYMPRSMVYDPDVDPTMINVGVSTSGGTTTATEYPHQSFFNGKQVLVAYEFSVYDEGIYILGATGFYQDGEQSVRDTVPTQIVYFSAEGVASQGQDGEIITGAQLGTIDYVYDNGNGNRVITVTERIGNFDNQQGNKYDFYYPSYALLSFVNRLTTANGADVDINQVGVRLRRAVENSQSSITYVKRDPDNCVKFESFGTESVADPLNGTVSTDDTQWPALPLPAS